jgi:hypothetical protein
MNPCPRTRMNQTGVNDVRSWLGVSSYEPESQCRRSLGTAWTVASAINTMRPCVCSPHIKKLDDCFGQFLVRVICDCGACREIEPEALARLVGWAATSQGARAADALLEVRQEGREAQTARHTEE